VEPGTGVGYSSGNGEGYSCPEQFCDPISYKEKKNDENTKLVLVKEGNGVVSMDGECMRKPDRRWLGSNLRLVNQ